MKKSEPEHLIIQLRKIVNIGFEREVEFGDGTLAIIDPGNAAGILNKYNSLDLPATREAFQKSINNYGRWQKWEEWTPTSRVIEAKPFQSPRHEDLYVVKNKKARARAARRKAIKAQIAQLFKEV